MKKAQPRSKGLIRRRPAGDGATGPPPGASRLFLDRMTEWSESKGGGRGGDRVGPAAPRGQAVEPGTVAFAGTRLDSELRNPRRRRAGRDGYVKDQRAGPARCRA